MSEDRVLPKGVVRSREREADYLSPRPPLRSGEGEFVKRTGAASGETSSIGAGSNRNAGRANRLPLSASERGPGGEVITALEPQQRREGRVNVYLDGAFALGVSETVVALLGLKVGMTITPERLAEVQAAETRSRAREDAYRLLSYRPRSEGELAERLARKGYEPDVVAETQAHLREVGYLDDETFARGWVEARGRMRGRSALAWELRQKGVDNETARQALAEGQDAEAERDAARRMAVRKVGERPIDRSPEARARLAASLARRGFGWDVIRPVLAELYAAPPDFDDGANEAEESANFAEE